MVKQTVFQFRYTAQNIILTTINISKSKKIIDMVFDIDNRRPIKNV